MLGPEEGFVYFLDAPEVNRIKIGTAVCPEERIEAIGLMCPVDINLLAVMPGGRKAERDLHRRFSHLRRRGEWFEAAKELRVVARDIWAADMLAIWDAGKPEWREHFLSLVDIPVFDRSDV